MLIHPLLCNIEALSKMQIENKKNTGAGKVQMEFFYDTVNTHYCLNLCGMRKYKVGLGVDALGNLTRIENEIAKLPVRLEAAKTRKEFPI